jgi:hypothetical protein
MKTATPRQTVEMHFKPMFSRQTVRTLGQEPGEAEGWQSSDSPTCVGCCVTESSCGTNPGCSTS